MCYIFENQKYKYLLIFSQSFMIRIIKKTDTKHVLKNLANRDRK